MIPFFFTCYVDFVEQIRLLMSSYFTEWLMRTWLVLFNEDIILLLFFTNNTISLLFMLILWNKSGRKYLHTLFNG